MTEDKIALRALLEKGSDATFLREMIGFAAERLMQLETDGLRLNKSPTLIKSTLLHHATGHDPRRW